VRAERPRDDPEQVRRAPDTDVRAIDTCTFPATVTIPVHIAARVVEPAVPMFGRAVQVIVAGDVPAAFVGVPNVWPFSLTAPATITSPTLTANVEAVGASFGVVPEFQADCQGLPLICVGGNAPSY
jgi:hypothetical protein